MWFNLRMDADTKSKLNCLAKGAGLSRSMVVRRLIEGATLRQAPPMEYHLMLEELRRIGVNLNQIAAAANALGMMDAPAYEKAGAELRGAVLAIRRAAELS